jgi:hypothetical protein
MKSKRNDVNARLMICFGEKRETADKEWEAWEEEAA